MSVYLSNIDIKLVDWAINRAGKTIQDFADFREKTLNKKITFKQLEDFAKKTNVPVGYLFLNEIPQETPPVADFRVGRLAEKCYSLEVADTINELLVRQDWIRDYFIEQDFEKCGWIDRFSLNDSPVDVANFIREKLNVEENWQNSCVSADEAFRLLRSKIEEQNILVFLFSTTPFQNRRKLDPEEFRGAAFKDEFAPFVFINANDARAAKLYTLLHELAHLLLGDSGILGIKLEDEKDCADERECFCDSVAANFLTPYEQFESYWKKYANWGDRRFSKIARLFKVSEWAVIKRAYTLQKISWDEYSERCNVLEAKWRQNKLRQENSQGGSSYFTTAKNRLGVFFVHVYNAAYGGSLLFRDAYRFTGVKNDSFNRLIQEY